MGGNNFEVSLFRFQSFSMTNAQHSLKYANSYSATYTQYGPITNGGIRACDDATVRYKTILRVQQLPAAEQLVSLLWKFWPPHLSYLNDLRPYKKATLTSILLWLCKMKAELWPFQFCTKMMTLKIELKTFRLFWLDTIYQLPEKLERHSPGKWDVKLREIMYFDLKLNWATQLSNNVRGSKYSAHHSRLSVLLIPLSYLIPTVRSFQ